MRQQSRRVSRHESRHEPCLRPAHRRCGGYILVAVLGLMLVLTGFMAAGSLLVRSALDTVRVADADASTIGLTRAGLELTAYQLFVIKADPSAVDGRHLRVSGGSFVAHLIDEGGKADLNASDSKLLGSVFTSAGLNEDTARSLIACIVGVRGPDRAAGPAPLGAPPQPPASAPTSPSGDPADLAAAAQQQVSAQQSPTAPPANKPKLRGFQTVEQLRDCPDITREDFSAIAPMLTVYNPDGKIDILTARPAMLSALPGVSPADVGVILARRDNPDKKAGDDLMALMKEAAAYGKTGSGPAFTVRIDAVSATGRKKTIHAVIASSKSRDEPFYVLDRWD